MLSFQTPLEDQDNLNAIDISASPNQNSQEKPNIFAREKERGFLPKAY